MSESYVWSGRPAAADRGTAPERGQVPADHEFARGLVGSVTHHLRTPLTVVLGHAELLIDREQELPSEVRQSVVCMLRAAERLNDVVVAVADLVDIACVRSHTLEVVDISELVADEVATCWAVPRNKEFDSSSALNRRSNALRTPDAFAERSVPCSTTRSRARRTVPRSGSPRPPRPQGHGSP